VVQATVGGRQRVQPRIARVVRSNSCPQRGCSHSMRLKTSALNDPSDSCHEGRGAEQKSVVFALLSPRARQGTSMYPARPRTPLGVRPIGLLSRGSGRRAKIWRSWAWFLLCSRRGRGASIGSKNALRRGSKKHRSAQLQRVTSSLASQLLLLGLRWPLL
jgi:hypothetical protein